MPCVFLFYLMQVRKEFYSQVEFYSHKVKTVPQAEAGRTKSE